MTRNAILDEIHAVRRKILADYDGDTAAYFRDAQARLAASGRPIAQVKQRKIQPFSVSKSDGIVGAIEVELCKGICMTGKPISRSERFVMHFQLTHLVDALRTLLQSGVGESSSAAKLLNKLQMDSQALTQGRCMDGLPTVEEGAPVAELLILASNLEAISRSFLTPEEIEEIQRFGFHTLASDS